MDKKFNKKSLEVSRCAVGRPSWESRNDGVHERVNFDDTIWGFSLAGGSYYETPLRVTEVKEGSRAERAGIKVGDVLKSINNLDTSHLTIQEAHDIIVASGYEILLNVVADRPLVLVENQRYESLFLKLVILSGMTTVLTFRTNLCTKAGNPSSLCFYAPDVEETTYTVYQDELEDELTTTSRLHEEEDKKRTISYFKIKKYEGGIFRWPCNKKRDVLYRESNCYLVPSRYEASHPQAILKNDSDEIARTSVIV